MKAYSFFSIVITSLGLNLEAPSVLASTFIDSATYADAEPISNCCGAYVGRGGDGCTEGICDCIMGAMSWVSVTLFISSIDSLKDLLLLLPLPSWFPPLPLPLPICTYDG